ncbi:hypothetical protein [Rhodoferax sp.]|uniref:hypothetical protein n=1 Tax=Rhodoferax sp. TaxID=50421 RepID=UPI0025FCEA71|nr:hypothetical protein [Rhodoferax sp.]
MRFEPNDSAENSIGDASGQLRIHYYLADGSHKMDALTRNQCEAEILGILSEFSRLFEIKLDVESQAYGQGGLQDYLSLIGQQQAQVETLITVLVPLFGFANWAIHIGGKHKLTKQQIQQNELVLEKTRLELKRMQRDEEMAEKKSETHELPLEPIPSTEEIIRAALSQKKIAIRRSNMYRTLMAYDKVKAIGFSKYHAANSPEFQIERTAFPQFIIDPEDIDPISLESVNIEIVSPVLRDGKNKWRGIFEKQSISFELDDSTFKKSVLTRQVKFQNGSMITCDLDIQLRENELGDIETVGYVVRKVHEISDVPSQPTSEAPRQLNIDLAGKTE